MLFRRIQGVKRSVFAENAEWNGAFSPKTRYSRKSGYVLGFKTYLNKIFEILGLGLVYYWMMPKNWEKRTIKSRACLPLRLGSDAVKIKIRLVAMGLASAKRAVVRLVTLALGLAQGTEKDRAGHLRGGLSCMLSGTLGWSPSGWAQRQGLRRIWGDVLWAGLSWRFSRV